MIKKPQTDPPECSADILAMMDTLDIIGGKWTLLIVHYLISRTERVNTFNKIRQDIALIALKVLTATLKMLVANHIVTRIELKNNVSSVDYKITAYSMQLKPLIEMLVLWGQGHRKEMLGLDKVD